MNEELFFLNDTIQNKTSLFLNKAQIMSSLGMFVHATTLP